MKRRFYLGAIAGLVAGEAWAKPKSALSFGDFRQIILSKIKRDYRNQLQVVGEPLPGWLRIRRVDGLELIFKLPVVYQEALKVSDDPQAFLVAQLDPLVIPLDLASVQTRLLPRFLSQQQYQKLWSGRDLVATSVDPDLLWTVVLDVPATVWPLTLAQAQTWGWTKERLVTTALENLQQRTDIPFLLAGERSGIWVIHRGDSYDAERLLLTDLLSMMRATKTNPLLLSAPSQDWLVILENNSADAPERLRRVIARIQASEADTALPPLLFAFDRQLVPYL